MATDYFYEAVWREGGTEKGHIIERYTGNADQPSFEIRRDIQLRLAARHPEFQGAWPDDIHVQLVRIA